MFAQFEEYDRKIFWTLVFIGAGALLLYVYFLSVSVVAVIARKDAEREVGRMTAQVASLESQYASLDKDIDLTLAHNLGFIDISTQKYISSEAKDNALTLRGNIFSH